MRVVSLVPSSTETLLALGADVIACTRFCEQPGLPHVGGTKNPDVAAILALAPDVVVVDREENRREDADALTDAGLALFVSEVTSVDGARRVVDDLADLLGLPPLTDDVPAVEPLHRSIFVPIWRRPWMSINRLTYGASLLEHLGCRLVTADLAAPYPEVTIDEVAQWQPDIIAVPTEPYEFSDAHLDELGAASPGSAVRRIDGQDLFWWGSRTSGAVRRLHASLSGDRAGTG